MLAAILRVGAGVVAGVCLCDEDGSGGRGFGCKESPSGEAFESFALTRQQSC